MLKVNMAEQEEQTHAHEVRDKPITLIGYHFFRLKNNISRLFLANNFLNCSVV